jgi:excisionase family DNA binding protein
VHTRLRPTLPMPARPRGSPWPSERDPVAVPIREAAELAGVKPNAIRSRVKTGRLRAFRLGRRLVIRIADLARYRRPGYESAC